MNNPQSVTFDKTKGSRSSFAEILARQAKEREIPVKITLDDYAEAIIKLVKLARTGCGGARAAAQVVLSLYNGENWHVNLIDLMNLDGGHFRAAIIAIRGRWEFNREPHEMITHGDDVFDQLQDDWSKYHTKNRYKQK